MAGNGSLHDSESLTGDPNKPLVGVLVEENGRRVVRYVFGDIEDPVPADADSSLRAALAVVGAWRDLDWDEWSAELDRIRHENPPTPPIDL